jgi:predicted permease
MFFRPPDLLRIDMSWLSRLTNILSVRRVDRDLDEEHRFHLAARIDDLMRDGLTRDQATAQAARRFGGRLQARESSRDVRLLPWLDSLARDVRHGVRLLRKDRGVTTAAVLSLALAIGACAAAFSLIDALILRPLPVRDPDGLLYVAAGAAGDEDKETVLSYPLFERFRSAAPAKVEIFSMSEQSLRQAILPDTGGQEEQLRVQFVSGNAMPVLGISAALGRLIAATDDRTPGAHPVAVISHAFWTRRLGGDRHVIGRTFQIEQVVFEVVGVAAAGFTGTEPGMLTDVWVPNMMWASPQAFTSERWGWLRIWGRLAPGVELAAIRPILQTAYTNERGDVDPGKARLAPKGQMVSENVLEVRAAATGASALRTQFARPLLVLAAVVGSILLIACSNIANLLLARGAARDREMTLRASIGASRSRLLQQVLVEAAMLTAAATLLGLGLTRVAVPVIVGMLAASDNPVYLDTAIDVRVVLFVVVLGALTTLLFGLAPAIRASRVTPTHALTPNAALGARYAGRSIVLRPLLAVQMGFSLVVLFVAGLLLQSFNRLTQVDLGFRPEQVALITIEARERLTDAVSDVAGFQLREAAGRLPGAQSASLSDWALFAGWSSGGSLGVPGRGVVQTRTLGVSPGFCRTMGIRLLDGREFERTDSNAEGMTAVIVNEEFARRYFPGERAVGQRVERTTRWGTNSLEIVGVAANVKNNSIRAAASPFVFLPMSAPVGTLQIRTTLDASLLAARLREVLPRVHPSLRLTGVSRQSLLVDNALLRERLLAVLSAFFASIGLALSAIGLYGVSSYAVLRHTREIGIRLALGANPAAVVRSVLGGVALALVLGVALGVAGGLFFSRFVRTLLFEIEPLDPANLAVSVGALAAIALLATWRPARRAARVDPVVALRTD